MEDQRVLDENGYMWGISRHDGCRYPVNAFMRDGVQYFMVPLLIWGPDPHLPAELLHRLGTIDVDCVVVEDGPKLLEP